MWNWLRKMVLRSRSVQAGYRGGWDDCDSSTLFRGPGINSIHVHKAANGFVIEHFGRPDKNGDRAQTLWAVQEGENVTNAITRAVVAGSIEK